MFIFLRLIRDLDIGSWGLEVEMYPRRYFRRDTYFRLERASVVCQVLKIWIWLKLNGIRMDPKKIEAIKDWSRPITVIEVKSFSGFSRLFQEICEGFLQYSSSLANLTRKNIKFNWTDRCEEYFLLLKNLLARWKVYSVTWSFSSRIKVCADAEWEGDCLCFTSVREARTQLPYSWIGNGSCDICFEKLEAFIVRYDLWNPHRPQELKNTSFSRKETNK